jgi:pimeloyl-ACP methyl ester carboxylesterase
MSTPVIALIEGYAKAFSRTITGISHDPAEARLADVAAPALVVMGEQDPDFPDPRAEADWIARALRAQVVMVPEAGHYPQSQRPDITTGTSGSTLLPASRRGPARPSVFETWERTGRRASLRVLGDYPGRVIML